MRNEELNYQKIIDGMSFRGKLWLLTRANIYLFWRITLMDVIIVVPVFILFGMGLDRCTGLPVSTVVVISLAVCSIIEFIRIRFRRVKTLRSLLSKMDSFQKTFDTYAELAGNCGTEEDRRKVEDIAGMMERARDYVEQMADIAFKEDVLGFDKENMI